MNAVLRQVRPIVRVGLPVAVAGILVCLGILCIALVRSWHHADDGVLWSAAGGDVVAEAVAADSAADRAGVKPGDVLLAVDGRDVQSTASVHAVIDNAQPGQVVTFRLLRVAAQRDFSVTLQPMPTVDPVYYPLAIIGILSIVLGASVRLRRPNDPATLHFFWLTVAFGATLSFSYSGQLNRLDYFFLWADQVALLALPPLFLHFAFVFPDRSHPWIKTDAGRAMLPLFYAPALLLGLAHVVLVTRGLHGPGAIGRVEQLRSFDLLYLSACLLGGFGLMGRALGRLRSVTARRQLRWIVWGSAIGVLPFVCFYALPWVFGHPPKGAEYTALLLGCMPLAFASAIVRYRLMDVEVIIKRTLVVSSWVLFLALIYGAIFWLVGTIFGTQQDKNTIALLATLAVALIAPSLRNAVQAALDRLYYRDRYDYRRALVTFARELNSDLDLDRLSTRLVSRIQDTLVVDRIALLLARPSDQPGDFRTVASLGLGTGPLPAIARGSSLGSRLASGQTVVVDDPLPLRRLSGDDANVWREAGLFSFVPCVSKEGTIAVIALGRKARSEPLSSEDMTLLGAVAGQAATALENARLYGQLRDKAGEIERLREFSDSVVESLSDGLLVLDLDDRVVRWNRRLEELFGLRRDEAIGRRLSALFDKAFLETLLGAWRESPEGATLYRVPMRPVRGGQKRGLLMNVGLAPLRSHSGTRTGSIVVLEDITDRANLEEQLRLSEKMAAIGLLAAGVAHEVNTPLTGISSFTQMLLERSDPADPNTQLLEKIERQTFRAAKIVNSLLNLSRPSDGEAGPVDVHVVIGDVLSLLEHQLRNSRIQVRKDLASSPLVVRGAEYKLQQVFLNLFLNARDAMAKGGWLSIATRTDERGTVIEVADTGGGIPAEHIARIYDPFFTTKADGRGTGLGLSVTYGIVQEHGGTLTCTSAVGQGTTFTLVLPAYAPARVEAAAH